MTFQDIRDMVDLLGGLLIMVIGAGLLVFFTSIVGELVCRAKKKLEKLNGTH